MVHGLNLPSTPNDAITHIWTVTLDFVLHGRHTDFVTAYDWTEFDRNLFRLAQSYQLRKFCLGFRSQEDLDRFVEIGVPRMPHLSIIREVVFAIWNSKESKWKRELPQADVNLGIVCSLR
ncbi:hypothetical protein PHLCEN_2v2363 [Hermanssonia centrifuga]|uniref:Uncharacterized protein n=1 Tax=Hermanssonia centrifuga TaxID=98765 RepID=A0A2R6RM52_9APHY|nr:hypothetical protein PHLCEN_2v2363 [Hermanssonia centrifuga]